MRKGCVILSVEFNDKIPIYIQIIDMIKRDMVIGKLKAGDKLPSVREISSELKVNPNTIQRVYQELERLDLTYTQRGMGTFVKGDDKVIVQLKKNMSKDIIDSFIEGMIQLGFTWVEIMECISERIKKGVK